MILIKVTTAFDVVVDTHKAYITSLWYYTILNRQTQIIIYSILRCQYLLKSILMTLSVLVLFCRYKSCSASTLSNISIDFSRY